MTIVWQDLRYRVRPATTADVGTIAKHRVGMFLDMGALPAAAAAPLRAASAAYFARAIATGDYLGWLAELDGAVVAGAGVQPRALLPRPDHIDGGVEAYVLNVYTEPAHRRRGLARGLMDVVLDWSRAQRHGRVTLHASDAGRPLYDTLGFAATTEMVLDLRR